MGTTNGVQADTRRRRLTINSIGNAIMSKQSHGLIALFSMFVLGPSIIIGLNHSIAIAFFALTTLSILFHISLTLIEIKETLHRKEAWFMKNMSPDEKERYWFARFRG